MIGQVVPSPRGFYDEARRQSGAFEVVFARPDGLITEGSFTSIFVERSGVLITVDLAMEIGRPIYAVPGEITSALSEGTNDLLRHGWATAITSALDVLGALGIEGASA